MPAHAADESLLQRALELARQGTGLASPNPYVGAVIADAQGNVVGSGTYTYAGMKHAEFSLSKPQVRRPAAQRFTSTSNRTRIRAAHHRVPTR